MTSMQKQDFISQALYLTHVMRGHDDLCTALKNSGDDVFDHPSRRRIEMGRWFIKKQDPWMEGPDPS